MGGGKKADDDDPAARKLQYVREGGGLPHAVSGFGNYIVLGSTQVDQ